MDGAVGALAISTIGGAFLIALYFYNRDPKNLAATKAVMKDDSSATTAVRGGEKPDHMS